MNQDNGDIALRIEDIHADEHGQHQSQPDLVGNDLAGNNTIRREIRRQTTWREVHIQREDYIRRIWRAARGNAPTAYWLHATCTVHNKYIASIFLYAQNVEKMS